jgi:DNA (cytosine-5)-methyltransferase 1
VKYFSTFTGIGGFELGIQNAYRATFGGEQRNPSEINETGTGLLATEGQGSSTSDGRISSGVTDIFNTRPLCIGYSEIDKYASSVYEHHFKGVKNYGDITRINADELPDFDCIVGGFPCQSFSIAGKRGGFNDTRGTLFFDLARILKAKRPRLFVFENVKGLLSHDGGRTFDTIIRTIDELGYDCQWQVLNSKNHGVPQNRERIYIVGHLRGTPRPEVFPIGEDGGEDTRLPGHLSNTLTTRYEAAQANGTYIGEGKLSAQKVQQLNEASHQSDRIYASEGISPTLGTMQGGNQQPKVLIPEATKKGYAEASVGQAINLSVPTSKTRRGRVSDIAPTLDTSMQIHTLEPSIKNPLKGKTNYGWHFEQNVYDKEGYEYERCGIRQPTLQNVRQRSNY